MKIRLFLKDFSPIVLGSRTRSKKTEPDKAEEGAGTLSFFLLFVPELVLATAARCRNLKPID